MGRLESDDPKIVAKQKLTFSTKLENKNPQGQAMLSGGIVVATDDKGRFRAPAIMAGSLQVTIPTFESTGSVYRADIPKNLYVSPGQTTDITIPLKKAVEVSGKIADRHSGKPIEGIKD